MYQLSESWKFYWHLLPMLFLFSWIISSIPRGLHGYARGYIGSLFTTTNSWCLISWHRWHNTGSQHCGKRVLWMSHNLSNFSSLNVYKLINLMIFRYDALWGKFTKPRQESAIYCDAKWSWVSELLCRYALHTANEWPFFSPVPVSSFYRQWWGQELAN